MKIMPPSRTSAALLILLFALAAYSTPASAGNINTTIVTDTARTLPLPSVPGTVSGVSGGGGEGGGGIITDELWSNILKYESLEKTLISGRPVRYTFTRYPDMPVYEIDLTGRENENYITVKVEMLKGLSPKIKNGPDGIVYRYINIYAGTQRIWEVRIKFKVFNEWLTDNNIADLTLTRWNGAAWEKLETVRIGGDDTSTFYESNAPSFSNFAIIGAPFSPPSPTVTATVQPETSAPTPAATTETPGFEGSMVAVMLLLFGIRRIRSQSSPR